MKRIVNIQRVQPAALQAMGALEKYLATVSLTETQKELIKIRASQMNGCAFCIDMHTKAALANGESPQRVSLLNAWKESSLFTNKERVLLQLTEEITDISNGVSPETYELAMQVFSENEMAEIIMTIVTINAWNRISIASRL